MTVISIDNAGSVGLIKDLSLDAMPIEAWNEINNIRCKEQVLQPWGTDKAVYADANYASRFFFNMRVANDPHWLVATDGKIYKITNTTETDITKLATTYSGSAGSVWSGFDYHRHQIMNNDNGVDLPQVLLPAASNFVDLTNWPAATYCRWMNSYKNFLIAYNITESGSEFPNRIKWSDLADTGQLPISWDETDLTLLAGENDELEQGGGQIMAARVLNDVNFVYKDNAVWFMYPRNDLRIWNFKQMEPRQGLLGSHAITTFQARHYLAIPGDIVENNGQRLTSIIDKRNRTWLFDNIHEDYFARLQILTNYKHKEIWVCFPDKTSTGELNNALIWNVVENSWSQRSLNDFSYLASGIIDTSSESQVIDDDLGIIDLDETIIDSISYNPSVEGILAGEPGNTNFWELDDLSSGILSSGTFERHGLTIVGRDRTGEWKFSAIASKQINRLYPKFTGSGTFNVYVGTSRSIDGAITWSSPEVFTIGGVPHVDFFGVTGEVMALRFEATGTQFYTYSGCDLEINVTHESTF